MDVAFTFRMSDVEIFTPAKFCVILKFVNVDANIGLGLVSTDQVVPFVVQEKRYVEPRGTVYRVYEGVTETYKVVWFVFLISVNPVKGGVPEPVETPNTIYKVFPGPEANVLITDAQVPTCGQKNSIVLPLLGKG